MRSASGSRGTLLLWMDFGRGSLPGPQTEGQSLVTFEAFKIYGGQVHAVEAVFQGMPANTPRGGVTRRQ